MRQKDLRVDPWRIQLHNQSKCTKQETDRVRDASENPFRRAISAIQTGSRGPGKRLERQPDPKGHAQFKTN